jgi:ABC-type polysaccharide/polyol phosphate transport system ATPase subunit
MCTNIAVKVEKLTKIYKIYNKPLDRIKEALSPLRRKYYKDFYALKDVSFEIKQGEAVGIIGKNGSGKSTLLKIITGVISPTEVNSLIVNGTISALLELGAGFNPELTGLENIYLNGTIMGYTKKEIDEKVDDIISFADIGDFIYQPVKLYSSGMFVRLAFAVAINSNPDILIFDEALSVGDMRFQQKCFRKIEEFKQHKTVIFVSHDLSIINKYCNRVIWLNDGTIFAEGNPEEISKQYQAFMMGSKLSKLETNNSVSAHKKQFSDDINLNNKSLDVLGDNKATILGVGIFDADIKEKLSLLLPGQRVNLVIRVKYNVPLENPIVGFTIKDRLGNIVTQSNTYVLDKHLEAARDGEICDYCFEFNVPNLTRGLYSVSPAVASGTQEEHTQHSWIHDALVFQVLDKRKYELQGYIFLDDIKFYNL